MTESCFATIETMVFSVLEKELSPKLHYHCAAHTADVLEQVQVIAAAENITDKKDLLLLKLAALFHDTGFLNTYAQHEAEGCVLAHHMLQEFDLAKEDVEEICRMIMTTEVPQKPYNKLSQILCDADLDYLGRDDFFTIGPKLKEEWFNYGIIKTDEDWEQRQLRFLDLHRFHTDYSVLKRNPKKLQHLAQLRHAAAL